MAEALVDVSRDVDKPIVACWMAGHLVERAVKILERNGGTELSNADEGRQGSKRFDEETKPKSVT
ncbi:MAG: hypothetical protein NWE79_03115 [Candidatus Bathyarchaeota archaeon]|nr:hypothetical protein [Candidatus Bathyarchaeota archaeon]